MIVAVTGTTVGHYQILEKLGEGGMGVVYKARDVLLNRTAALKFLPAGSGADEKRRRFLQEAQSASALNHPNIVTIYEVGQSEDLDYIAMELVQGQSLDQAIGGRALPMEKAIAWGIQIADALAAAHAAGIAHRDLKPANVMITGSGVVKVLDFGLAKLVASTAVATDATHTMLAAKTADGAIVGTVFYMSPEQAEGKPVDARSDIFSFGAVLLEMLTGRRAFQRDSAVSTLAAILTSEPQALSTASAALPGDLARIVSRCLRKAPEKRWQSVADVRIALEEFKQDLESGRLTRTVQSDPKPRRRWITIAVPLVLAAGLAGFAVSWAMRPAHEPELWGISRITSDSGASMSPAVSRDGRLVAYMSDRATGDSIDLWVQQVEGGDPVQLTKGLPYCREPDFSPDGSRIVFHCGVEPDDIYVISTLGGLPRKVAQGESPRFSPDGSTISYLARASGDGNLRSLWLMPAAGGAAKEIKISKGINGGAAWTPDGKGLLLIAFGDPQDGRSEIDWYFVPVDGGPMQPTGAVRKLAAAGLGPGRDLNVTPDGVVFAVGNLDSTNIYRLPFDASFRKVAGGPVPIVMGAGFSFTPGGSQDGHRIAFAVGNNLAVNIWRATVDAKTGKVAAEPVRVTSGLGGNRAPFPSRDGKRVAYIGGTPNASEVRIRDLATGKDLRLAEAKEWSLVALSPNDATVAFNSDQRSASTIYTVGAAGGIPKKICDGCGRPVEWLRDGAKLLIDNAGPQHRDIHLLDAATGQTKPLVLHSSEYQLTMPRLSPDGRSLCFTELRPGRARRILVAPFTGETVQTSEWIVVVDGAHFDRQPFWSQLGNTIYFVSDRDGARCIWAQRMDPASRQPVGQPFAAHHMHQVRYNLMDVGDVASVGLAVVEGQMFYAAFELQTNIWLARPRRPLPAPGGPQAQ
jgi:serine/threonine protein kinase